VPTVVPFPCQFPEPQAKWALQAATQVVSHPLSGTRPSLTEAEFIRAQRETGRRLLSMFGFSAWTRSHKSRRCTQIDKPPEGGSFLQLEG